MHLNHVSSIYLCIFLLFEAAIWVILDLASPRLTITPPLPESPLPPPSPLPHPIHINPSEWDTRPRPLYNPPPAPNHPPPMHSADFILLLVVQTGLILALSRIMGYLFVRFRQPQVMGEMIAGIMLGPSLFGWLAPQIFHQVFTSQSIPYLEALSQIGVIFFLFLIGLELDPKLIRNRGRTALLISNASIIAPFLMGVLVALLLYPKLFNARRPLFLRRDVLRRRHEHHRLPRPGAGF